jgi:hypothetical protein
MTAKCEDLDVVIGLGLTIEERKLAAIKKIIEAEKATILEHGFHGNPLVVAIEEILERG